MNALKQMTGQLRIFRRPALLVIGTLIALSLSRLVLVGIHSERVAATYEPGADGGGA